MNKRRGYEHYSRSSYWPEHGRGGNFSAGMYLGHPGQRRCQCGSTIYPVSLEKPGLIVLKVRAFLMPLIRVLLCAQSCPDK